MKHGIHRILMIGIVGLLTPWLVGCGALVTTPPPAIHATGSTAITKPYPTPDATQAVYSNALTQLTTGWANSAACTFTPNGLAVRPDGGQAYICLAPIPSVTDMSVKVTVQQTTGSLTHAFGIAFHHTAPKNYYFFGIDGRGRFTLTIVVNDVSHVVLPFTRNTVIHGGMNVTNQLQVITKGQNVTLLVNGSPVGQATLSTFAAGTVGLRGINDGKVIFQQLSISPV
ncbi:MAG: hypothetical protein NVS4B11_14230 [Ktedonobacteraceae bacterium]